MIQIPKRSPSIGDIFVCLKIWYSKSTESKPIFRQTHPRYVKSLFFSERHYEKNIPIQTLRSCYLVANYSYL